MVEQAPGADTSLQTLRKDRSTGMSFPRRVPELVFLRSMRVRLKYRSTLGADSCHPRRTTTRIRCLRFRLVVPLGTPADIARQHAEGENPPVFNERWPRSMSRLYPDTPALHAPGCPLLFRAHLFSEPSQYPHCHLLISLRIDQKSDVGIWWKCLSEHVAHAILTKR